MLTTTRLDEYAEYALAPNAVTWINRNSGALARNGTGLHTLNFTPALTGSLLVAVVVAPALQTAVSAGWTKRLSPTNGVEVAVYTRNANAGDASLQIQLSGGQGSDFPVVYSIHEFPSGSYWHSGAQVQQTATNATLSGLPGTGITVFQAGGAERGSGAVVGNTAYWYFWRTDTNETVLYDGAVYGAYLNMGYFVNFPDGTADITLPALQKNQNTATYETVMFAIATP